MSRSQLEDRINYCKRELDWLLSVQTNCHNCDSLKYKSSHCMKYDQDVPADYMVRNDCPDWQFNDVPF